MDEQKRKITLTVAAQIKYFRIMRSMSQEEVALQANITPAYFGQVERGLKCPTVDTLYRIANALYIAPSELVQESASSEQGGDYSQRVSYLLSRIPSDKIDQVIKLLEDVVDLL